MKITPCEIYSSCCFSCQSRQFYDHLKPSTTTKYVVNMNLLFQMSQNTLWNRFIRKKSIWFTFTSLWEALAYGNDGNYRFIGFFFSATHPGHAVNAGYFAEFVRVCWAFAIIILGWRTRTLTIVNVMNENASNEIISTEINSQAESQSVGVLPKMLQHFDLVVDGN